MATFFTNFSNFTTGALSADWVPLIEADSNFRIAAVAGATGGKVLEYHTSTANFIRGKGWAGASGPGVVSGDVEIYSKFVTTDEADRAIRFYLHTSLDGSARASYSLSINHLANTVTIVEYTATGGASLSSVNMTLVGTRTYNVRFGRNGTALRAKIWEDGTLEPGIWNAGNGSDGTLSSGYVGLGLSDGLNTSSDYRRWDIFSIGTGASSAPTIANTKPVITVAPVVSYGATYTRLGTGNTPITISFTATDAEQTLANALTYAIRNTSNTLVGSGTCTSGVQKIHSMDVLANGLVNGTQTLNLTVSDGTESSTVSSFSLNRDTIAPSHGAITYENVYG